MASNIRRNEKGIRQERYFLRIGIIFYPNDFAADFMTNGALRSVAATLSS